MWTRLQIPTPKPSEGDHCDENEKAICNEMLTLPSHLAWSCILVVSGYPRFIRALTCKVIYGSSSYTINWVHLMNHFSSTKRRREKIPYLFAPWINVNRTVCMRKQRSSLHHCWGSNRPNTAHISCRPKGERKYSRTARNLEKLSAIKSTCNWRRGPRSETGAPEIKAIYVVYYIYTQLDI